MKLIINSGSTFKGGSEQVALSFIDECRNYPEHDFHVVIGKHLANRINRSLFPNNFFFYVLKIRPASGIFTFIKSMLWFRKLERKVKPDCVIATGGHGYWRPKAPLVTGFNMAHYLYPESPYFSRMSFKRRIYWKFKKIIDLYYFSRVDVFLTQTDDVNKRVRQLMKKNNVYTVSNTVNGQFYEPQEYPHKLPDKGKGEIRLLTLSSYYPHKNLEIINDVILELLKRGIRNMKFVLTIPEPIYQSKFSDVSRDYIYNIGPVSINECPSLYKEIDFMFLPTLLECFSASYAEAMIMKKPILTSDMDFAYTVCKDAAVYFDPLNPEDIVEKISNLSMDKDYQKKLIQRGSRIVKNLNTPASRAEKYLSICENLASHG